MRGILGFLWQLVMVGVGGDGDGGEAYGAEVEVERRGLGGRCRRGRAVTLAEESVRDPLLEFTEYRRRRESVLETKMVLLLL